MKSASENLFKQLSQKYSTPYKVQKLIRDLKYNNESEGDSMRSAYGAWLRRKAHCLEASLLAAAILEHKGYPPLVLSMDSKDDLGHVVFLFKEKTGWGSIGRSREEGLHGRTPIFRTIRDLTYSYYDPFIDDTGKLTAYEMANLDDSQTDWRNSSRNVWRIEQYLIDLKHRPLMASQRRFKKCFQSFKQNGFSVKPAHFWW